MSGYYDSKLKQDIDDGLQPSLDYIPLRKALQADIIDYSTIDKSNHPLIKAMGRVGKDAQVATAAFLRQKDYDVIFSYTDSISLPLAALSTFSRKRPVHIVTAHSISSGRRGKLLKFLHRSIELLIVYSDTVYQQCRDSIGIPESKLHLSLYHTDNHFFSRKQNIIRRNQICSVGLEKRDYPTLIEAVRDLDIEVRLTAFSPWSRDNNEVNESNLPPNVNVKRYSYTELRDLYAESRFLVLPLYNNEYAAGITALYEAMAMECPAIVSQTNGLRNMIQDGRTGIFVPPSDPIALRNAIIELLENPARAEQIGQNGRRLIEEHINIEAWTTRMVALVKQAVENRSN
jgi:glycosyltransferase involved in cell wall biosynthesis